jgi:hypothetical protein
MSLTAVWLVNIFHVAENGFAEELTYSLSLNEASLRNYLVICEHYVS